MGKFRLPVVSEGITLAEIPNRLAVYFEIGNCTLHCKGCHSKHLWDSMKDDCTDSLNDIMYYVDRYYETGANAILFMGGLRSSNVPPLKFITCILRPLYEKGYDIGLYDGGEWDGWIEKASRYCKWVKVGPYIEKLGGLDNSTTNQRFYEKIDGKFVDKTTDYFQKGE